MSKKDSIKKVEATSSGINKTNDMAKPNSETGHVSNEVVVSKDQNKRLKKSNMSDWSKVMIPTILANIAVGFFFVFDTWAISTGVGSNGLAAYSMAIPMAYLMFTFATICGAGIATQIARARASKNQHPNSFLNTLIVNVLIFYVIGIVFCLLFRNVFFTLSNAFVPMSQTGATWDVIGFAKPGFFNMDLAGGQDYSYYVQNGWAGVDPLILANQFFYVYMIMMFFFIMQTSFTNISRATGQVKYSFWFNIAGALINCVFELVIVVWLNYGTGGAALGTALSWVCVDIMFIILYRPIGKKDMTPKPWHLTKVEWKLGGSRFGTTFKTGFVSGVFAFIPGFTILMFSLMIGVAFIGNTGAMEIADWITLYQSDPVAYYALMNSGPVVAIDGIADGTTIIQGSYIVDAIYEQHGTTPQWFIAQFPELGAQDSSSIDINGYTLGDVIGEYYMEDGLHTSEWADVVIENEEIAKTVSSNNYYTPTAWLATLGDELVVQKFFVIYNNTYNAGFFAGYAVVEFALLVFSGMGYSIQPVVIDKYENQRYDDVTDTKNWGILLEAVIAGAFALLIALSVKWTIPFFLESDTMYAPMAAPAEKMGEVGLQLFCASMFLAGMTYVYNAMFLCIKQEGMSIGMSILRLLLTPMFGLLFYGIYLSVNGPSDPDAILAGVTTANSFDSFNKIVSGGLIFIFIGNIASDIVTFICSAAIYEAWFGKRLSIRYEALIAMYKETIYGTVNTDPRLTKTIKHRQLVQLNMIVKAAEKRTALKVVNDIFTLESERNQQNPNDFKLPKGMDDFRYEELLLAKVDLLNYITFPEAKKLVIDINTKLGIKEDVDKLVSVPTVRISGGH